MELFRRIIDRERYYLPVFVQQASFLQHASKSLMEMTEAVDVVKWRSLEKDIKACEVQGDALLTELYEQLSEKFIIRLRKLDIQTIAMSMDDLLDHINDSAKSFLLYRPERVDIQLADLAQYLKAQTDAIRVLVSNLSDIRKNYSVITTQCDRVTELEHAADETFEDYISFIFKNEKDPIQLIKYKNIAEILESSTDAAKRVSDTVRKIIIRYQE
jgi:uncharacterized protein Yka (UPF0111/DUF47 family)